eukprot:gene14182-15661_t
MSLRLIDFGTFDEVKQIAYFTFAVSNFSRIKDNKISRPFRHAGHIWKLQLRQKDDNLGMFVRWYGTKVGHQSHVRCTCTTGLSFSVLNHFDTTQTIHEGNFQEDDIFDRVGLGIGYGEIMKLKTLLDTPGFIIKDRLDISLRIKVKSTMFKDKVQTVSRPGRTFIRSMKFPFQGVDWSLILFPNGEHEEEDKKAAMENDVCCTEEKATLYLSRDPLANNPCLRHRVHFIIFIEGGPSFEVRQVFHESECLVFGTGYLMTAKKLRALCKGGTARVGVTFLDTQPYFNFAYDLRNNHAVENGIEFLDQRDIPWSFKLKPRPAENYYDEGDDLVSCCLTIDPKSGCRQIKALETRDKRLKAIWHARIMNFRYADRSVDAWSEQSDECGIFKRSSETHCISLPVTKSQMTTEKSPYLDDDLKSSVHISILNSNFTYNIGDVVVKIAEVKEIVSNRNLDAKKIARDYLVREQIWKLSLERVEEEKEDAITSQKESIEKQADELKEKEIIINSLEEKLEVVETYVKNLEDNSREDIDKFMEISITKLIERSRPDAKETAQMNTAYESLVKILTESLEDIVSVAPIGSYGQDTVTRLKTEVDVVVFVKGELESKLSNGDTQACLNSFIEVLKSKDESESGSSGAVSNVCFKNFQIKHNMLQCNGINGDGTNVNIYPTKNWFESGGYDAIYEASNGLTNDALGCFIIATSERQTRFIKNQDEQCKDLIRIVKRWRDGIGWQDNSNRPSSYVISLLVIHAYSLLNNLSIAKTQMFLKEVLIEVGFLLEEKENLRIEWDTFYELEDYPAIHTAMTSFIRDPVLPSRNVATEITDWTQFESEFKSWVTGLVP